MAKAKRIPRESRIGQRFGRLILLEILPGNSRHPRARCRCDCGNTHEAAIDSIIQGLIASCGCLRREHTGRLNLQHGRSHTREFRIWAGMLDRCYRSNSTMFPLYGAKGVRVADRWLEDFMTFLADKGPCPSSKHSIDRWPNPAGDYTPENTRWATPREQRLNQTRNRRITWNSETMTIGEWAVKLHFSATALYQRLGVMNWSIERAFTAPVTRRQPHQRRR